MNNQAKQRIGVRQEVALEEIKLAKKQWLRSVQLSGSLSPRDQLTLATLPAGQLDPGTVIPPFLNFGLGWNIGDAITQKNEVNIKKKEAEIFQYEINEEMLKVRKNVLAAYGKYLSSIEIFNARKKAEDDAESIYFLLTEKYRKDKATFEEYNNASSGYHNAVEKRLQSDAEIKSALNDLEEMLGVRWEKVERNKQRYEPRNSNKN